MAYSSLKDLPTGKSYGPSSTGKLSLQLLLHSLWPKSTPLFSGPYTHKVSMLGKIGVSALRVLFIIFSGPWPASLLVPGKFLSIPYFLFPSKLLVCLDRQSTPPRLFAIPCFFPTRCRPTSSPPSLHSPGDAISMQTHAPFVPPPRPA